MCTFGEIVEPGSRAVWEDWDDITEQNTPELKWQQDLESPDEIQIFLILEGKYLSDSIKSQKQNLELINAIPAINLLLYRSIVTSKYICTIVDYDLVLSSQIVELLRQYLTVSRYVVAIQTKPLANYQAIAASSSCLIRAITTSRKDDLDIIKFPKLEQPNIISGVAAGVISLREHLDESGTALVAFLENAEEYKVEEMDRLLQQLNISKTVNRPSSVLDSNLYI